MCNAREFFRWWESNCSFSILHKIFINDYEHFEYKLDLYNGDAYRFIMALDDHNYEKVYNFYINGKT